MIDGNPELHPPGRLEAFSDGVLAVAITLLVLDLKVPREGDVWDTLRRDWRHFAAYAVSFAIIGVIWVNHHYLCTALRAVDRMVLTINLLVLAAVVTIPFSTALMAEYLGDDGGDGRAAAVVYSLTMFAMGTAFVLLLRHLSRHHELLEAHAIAGAAIAYQRSVFGPVTYLVAAGIGAISPVACLAVHAAVALFFALYRPPVEMPAA